MKSMQRPSEHPRAGRRIAGRAQSDQVIDPYQLRHKPKEPAACPECGAVYHRGRWAWADKPAGAHAEKCPACRRTEDHLPAGIVTACGAYAKQRKAELIGLARNEERAETTEHALNRIIKIDETADGLVIETTDIHLPRRIGEALQRAHHGDLEMKFDEDNYFVRVDWHPPNET